MRGTLAAKNEKAILAEADLGIPMVDVKLVNIEGIWGSGKTTTLMVLSRHLIRCGTCAHIYSDEDDHNPLLKKFHATAQAKIDLSVDSWKEFSSALGQSKEVAVMESVFFNSPIISLLIHGHDEDQIIDYCSRTFDAVKEMNPVLFYLRHDDVSSGWGATCEKRGNEWRQFMERQLRSWFPSQPPRFSSMEEFLHELTSLMDRAFEVWLGKKLVIAVPPEDWHDYYREMIDFLSLPPIDRHFHSSDDHIGHYRETQSGRECVISAAGNILVLRGYFGPKRPLLFDLYAMDIPPIDNDCARFCIPDLISVDVAFERNRQGAVASIRVVGEQIIQAKGTSGDTCKDTIWLKV